MQFFSEKVEREKENTSLFFIKKTKQEMSIKKYSVEGVRWNLSLSIFINKVKLSWTLHRILFNGMWIYNSGFFLNYFF